LTGFWPPYTIYCFKSSICYIVLPLFFAIDEFSIKIKNMDVAKLTVSASVSEGFLWLYLDHVVIIENTERISLEVESGQEYVIHWFVKGKPGTSYSITISSPKEAQFQLTRGLRVSGKGFGGLKFKA
jgi:hypothetical protein